MGSLSGHPGIVSLHDSGFARAELPYLVMELMESGSLADKLDSEGPLSPQDAVEMMLPIVRAVQKLTRPAYCNRDIKPREHPHLRVSGSPSSPISGSPC